MIAHMSCCRTGPDARMSLTVTLEELYKGVHKTASINRRVVCRGCGSGKAKNKEKCKACGKCPNEGCCME